MLNLSTLSSNSITLEPLTINHANDLAEACQDGQLWKPAITSVPPPEQMLDYITKAVAMDGRQAFAVIDETTSKAIGSTSYYSILPLAKRLEIGYTWYAQSYWRSHVNTTCKLLLLSHAFDTLKYQTVGWRTDIDNHQSQQAIERLGAKKDGVIRGDRVRKNGVITDSVVYSMQASEWQQAKENLQMKLASYD